MRWEYCAVMLYVDDSHMDKFRILGDEGWEMVSVSDGEAYFRRRKIEAGPSEHKVDGSSEGPSV